MGASIHMHIEVKRGDRWLHFAAPHMFRDGYFFGLVAGVYKENKVHPIAEPRGLPDDLSEVTAFCYAQDKGYGLHHEGWLNAGELVELQERLWDEYNDKGENAHDLEFHYFNTTINGNTVAQHQGWDDVRLVFWFDN